MLLCPSKKWFDMQVPFVCLIEKETSLESGYNWEPRQNSYRSKKNDTHSIVKSFSKYTDEVPQSNNLYLGPHSLCNLNKWKYKLKSNQSRTNVLSKKFPSTKLTNIKPHPVGKNARQHTIKSIKDRSQIMERVNIMDRTPKKRNALNSLNHKW